MLLLYVYHCPPHSSFILLEPLGNSYALVVVGFFSAHFASEVCYEWPVMLYTRDTMLYSFSENKNPFQQPSTHQHSHISMSWSFFKSIKVDIELLTCVTSMDEIIMSILWIYGVNRYSSRNGPIWTWWWWWSYICCPLKFNYRAGSWGLILTFKRPCEWQDPNPLSLQSINTTLFPSSLAPRWN